MVDEAKAFCPGCGYAFVDERFRGQLTDFEAKGHTVQLGQTMYNQMLSDMGLNISKAPDPVKTQVEPVVPVSPPAEIKIEPPAKKGVSKWVIVAIILAILLFLGALIVVAAAIIVFLIPLNFGR